MRFDFDRLARLGILERWQPPVAWEDGSRLGVSATALQATLVAIDSFGRQCWASQETITQRAKLSIRTLRSCIRVLERMGVLACERAGQNDGTRITTNLYAILWHELETYQVPKKIQPSLAERASGRVIAQAQAPVAVAKPVAAESPRPESSSPTPAQVTPRKPKKSPARIQEEAAIVGVLSEAGLYPGTAVKLVRQFGEGLSIEQAREIVVEYQQGLKDGVLHAAGAMMLRIQFGEWPTARGGRRVRLFAEIEAAKQRRREAARIHIQSQQQSQAEESKQQEREAFLLARYGPVWDAMTSDEQLEFARRTLPEAAFGWWSSGRGREVWREQLLEGLEAAEKELVQCTR